MQESNDDFFSPLYCYKQLYIPVTTEYVSVFCRRYRLAVEA